MSKDLLFPWICVFKVSQEIISAENLFNLMVWKDKTTGKVKFVSHVKVVSTKNACKNETAIITGTLLNIGNSKTLAASNE